jgi:hypothetical protein
MKHWLQTTLLAALVGGSAMAASPATAASLSIGIGFPGVGFSYNSGGYCDQWGCPDTFWNYPIYYCPVYYRGRWYQGPVYYRNYRAYTVWIHGVGGDEWRRRGRAGARPLGRTGSRLLHLERFRPRQLAPTGTASVMIGGVTAVLGSQLQRRYEMAQRLLAQQQSYD